VDIILIEGSRFDNMSKKLVAAYLVCCIFAVSCSTGRDADEVPRRTGSSYSKVKKCRFEFEVNRALGSEGRKIAPRDWPKNLGEVRNREDHWVAPASAPIEWVLWRVDDEHKWIAGGFVDLQLGGTMSMPEIILLKTGLKNELPGMGK
jgi:hypothetical protein